MKNFPMICSALAAILIAGTIATTAFAASAPEADTEDYSYNTGKQSYEARMTEDQPLYDSEAGSAPADYSFNAGSQAAVSRNNAFAGMPTEEMEKEDVEAWFENNALGTGSAWSDGQYDESAVSSYGYVAGQEAYQQRHASFSESN